MESSQFPLSLFFLFFRYLHTFPLIFCSINKTEKKKKFWESTVRYGDGIPLTVLSRSTKPRKSPSFATVKTKWHQSQTTGTRRVPTLSSPSKTPNCFHSGSYPSSCLPWSLSSEWSLSSWPESQFLFLKNSLWKKCKKTTWKEFSIKIAVKNQGNV